MGLHTTKYLNECQTSNAFTILFDRYENCHHTVPTTATLTIKKKWLQGNCCCFFTNAIFVCVAIYMQFSLLAKHARCIITKLISRVSSFIFCAIQIQFKRSFFCVHMCTCCEVNRRRWHSNIFKILILYILKRI